MKLQMNAVELRKLVAFVSAEKEATQRKLEESRHTCKTSTDESESELDLCDEESSFFGGDCSVVEENSTSEEESQSIGESDFHHGHQIESTANSDSDVLTSPETALEQPIEEYLDDLEAKVELLERKERIILALLLRAIDGYGKASRGFGRRGSPPNGMHASDASRVDNHRCDEGTSKEEKCEGKSGKREKLARRRSVIHQTWWNI